LWVFVGSNKKLHGELLSFLMEFLELRIGSKFFLLNAEHFGEFIALKLMKLS